MAKRELIAKEDAIAICLKSWDESDAAQNIKDEQTITEQEIVKPILDKIRAEIQKLRGCTCSCSDGIIDDVEDIIDKCEAESEGV